MLCPNGIKKTKLVTFPRSGHHLLVRGLEAALRHKLVYSEYYNCVHNMNTCEYVNLQKSHDFELSDPIEDEMQYIIMIRGFELAVESWFKVSGEEDPDVFRKSKVDYFDKFMEKWVLNTDIKNKYVIPYHDFIDNKVKTICAASRFMAAEPDLDKLNEWTWRERNKYIKPNEVSILATCEPIPA